MARHQSCHTQIDRCGATGMGDRGTSFNNAIAAYQHLAGADEGAMLHIKDVGGMEHDGIAGGNGRGRLSLECTYSGGARRKTNAVAAERKDRNMRQILARWPPAHPHS